MASPSRRMRFSKNGLLDTTLHLALAKITVDGHTYSTGMEYNRQLPGPMLVICPGIVW